MWTELSGWSWSSGPCQRPLCGYSDGADVYYMTIFHGIADDVFIYYTMVYCSALRVLEYCKGTLWGIL